MKRKQNNQDTDPDKNKKHQKTDDDDEDSEELDDFDADEDSLQSDVGDESEDDFEDDIDIDSKMQSSDAIDTSLSTKISKKKLFKPPTNDELNQLKETENLYHSSLFRMQITELLSEIKLKAKRQRQIEQVFTTVKDMLLGITKGKAHELMDQDWLPKKFVKVPLHQSPEAVKGRFQFLPPAEVKMVGSFLSNTCVKPNVTLDISVTMPVECLQSKDNLNQRYLRKRALYLAVLAKHLRKKEEVEDLHFTYLHGSHYKPILILKVKGDTGKPVTVHLHVIAEEGLFKLNRFHINKNNVRKQWYRGETEDVEEGDQPATPLYNMEVLSDLTLTQNNDHLTNTLGDSQGIREGIYLLKVWLRQRELDMGYGGFSGYILSMYVAYLLSKRRLNKMMSSYQVFRNTLLNLSKSEWTTEGITSCEDGEDSQRPLLSNFLETFDVVFVDVTGYFNICACMNKSCYNRVHYEAGKAMLLLEDHSLDSFSLFFMTPLPFLRKFDNVFHIRDLSCLETSVTKFDLADRAMDLGGDVVATVTPSLISVLQRALDRRITLLQVKQESTPQWSINDDPPTPGSQGQITVGVLLNPDTCTSVIEKGPPADSPEAEDFRSFWGEKSELRRFKDGSICEAVVWMQASNEISIKRTVCSEAVKHILLRQAGIPAESICYIGHQLDPLLYLPARSKAGFRCYGTGEEETIAVTRTYDSLCKILRNLKDLPLTINSIQGTSPAFRYTEVFPPLPATAPSQLMEADDTFQCPKPTKPTPPHIPVLKIVCMMEGSGKWPDEIEPFRRLKAAFHIALGKILSNEHKLVVRTTPGYVDVKKNNYIFRVELAYTREIALIKSHRTPEGMMKMRDTSESIQLEKEIVALPKLTSTLHGVQQQHNTFSGAVRLAKRWVSSQLLVDHIRDEALELMVAQLYIAPNPFSVPNSPLVGFLRFLHLLSHHDWSRTPLLVNLNQEFTAGDYAEISSTFSNDRKTLPLMFISTPGDKLSSHWTTGSPTAPILQRLILLAKESLKVLESQLNSSQIQAATDFKQIFRPPMDIYDVIIHLRQRMVPRQNQAVDINNETTIPLYLTDRPSTVMPVYEFDPVQLYLSELRAVYSDYALFFCDRYGGNLIGVLWKPQAFDKSPFSVNRIAGKMPILLDTDKSSDIQTIGNIEAILEDFQVLGGGLVSKVEIKKWDFGSVQ
ncbi:nucleolar protein 6-like [Mizuhopecten yessoensis]|uniref:Nucleolar protein 6 n=1 Tax=Mizuhopecten yessoensis TaxID=6573 RepID=A0A210QGQ5_MIZYE|nr:nucleolar protein 6-like [Mizuhopecten yessoensis]OWF47935.1 Nucleolar protein 6 [Mizuhopecten yessoensis]